MRKSAVRKQSESEAAELDRLAFQPRDVYDVIKADILSLALAPGQDLDEVSLARRYNVSRTPIREALIRLDGERLIKFGQNRRASVTALILADYPRFIETLDLMRRAVSRLAAARRHDNDIEKIRLSHAAFVKAAKGAKKACDVLARTISPLEANFQLAVAEAGHNSYLTASYRQLMTVGHRMLHLPYAYEPDPGEPVNGYVTRTINHHNELMDAITQGQQGKAENCARVLTQELVLRLRSYLEENLVSGVTVVMPAKGVAKKTERKTRQ